MQGTDAVVTVRHAAVEPGLQPWPHSRGGDAAGACGLLPWLLRAGPNVQMWLWWLVQHCLRGDQMPCCVREAAMRAGSQVERLVLVLDSLAALLGPHRP